jgi:hypothetical protein
MIISSTNGALAPQPEGMMNMAATVLTPAEIATEFDTDARTVRKFLRSVTPKDAQPGKGSRWAIEKKQLRSLRSQYGKWVAAQEAARAAREEATDEVEETAPEE